MSSRARDESSETNSSGIGPTAGGEEPAGTLPPGTVVGEYIVDKKLGEGAFGTVYAGENPVIGRRAAIKVLAKRFSSDPEVVSRFVAEARAVNRIRHRNIVDIVAFGTLPSGQQYLVMELLEGQTLRDFVHERGSKLSLEAAAPILVGIAAALDAAHEHGIVHRDLKPDNVFVAREAGGELLPKLLDFGVAKLEREPGQAHKTATGVAVGTPLYMSPEQCRGKKVDHRSDIYSFGALIFEMLAGAPPFDGESAMDVLMRHISDPIPRLSTVAPGLPPALDQPLFEMLAKTAAARPASAGLALARLLDEGRAAGLALAPYAPLLTKRVEELRAEGDARPDANLATRKIGAVQREVDESARTALAPSTPAVTPPPIESPRSVASVAAESASSPRDEGTRRAPMILAAVATFTALMAGAWLYHATARVEAAPVASAPATPSAEPKSPEPTSTTRVTLGDPTPSVESSATPIVTPSATAAPLASATKLPLGKPVSSGARAGAKPVETAAASVAPPPAPSAAKPAGKSIFEERD